MKIVFMGTPDFAKQSLQALYNNKHEIIEVITNPDKPQGRGMKLMPSPVKQYTYITTRKNKGKYRIHRKIKTIKSRCYMCCSIWKIIT